MSNIYDFNLSHISCRERMRSVCVECVCVYVCTLFACKSTGLHGTVRVMDGRAEFGFEFYEISKYEISEPTYWLLLLHILIHVRSAYIY